MTARGWATLAGIGLLATGGAALAWPALTAQSLLSAASALLALPSGALALLAIGRLTGGGWYAEAAPALRSLTALLPLALIAFVPLLAGLGLLYPWTEPAHSLEAVVQHKLAWLNETAFLARALVLAGLWALMAWLLRGDKPVSPARAVVVLLLWLPVVSLWGIDWLMSLEPAWYSSLFGLLLAAQHLVAALAAAILVAAPSGAGDPQPGHDLGNLLLGGVLLWAYMAFMQLLIVWEADLPHQAGWYLTRVYGAWLPAAAANALLHFALPFALLLSRQLKRTAGGLRAAAALVLAGHLVDCLWLVAPAFPGRPLWAGVLDLLALLALGLLALVVLQRHTARPGGAGAGRSEPAHG